MQHLYDDVNDTVTCVHVHARVHVHCRCVHVYGKRLLAYTLSQALQV